MSVLRDVTGLTAATTYYVQAIGVNAAGTTYGNVVSFRTRSAPTVTSVTPATGPLTGLTVVTIRGTGFEGPAGVTIGGTAASGVTVVNSTTITATTPANPVRGTYDVVVTNLDSGSATRAAAFRYVDRNLVRAAAAGRANTPYVVAPTGGVISSPSVAIFAGGGSAAFVNATTISFDPPGNGNGTTDVYFTYVQGGNTFWGSLTVTWP